MAASKTLTRRQRVERAKKAAAARESTSNLIKKLVDRSPDLAPEDVERLRALLPPVDHTAA
jgi:hypothetical protein